MPKTGEIVKGRVVKIFPKRAIVELGNRESGSIYISHVAGPNVKYVKSINDFLKVGQEVDVRVIGYNAKQNKYDLSIKFLDDELFKTERFKDQMKKFLEDSADKLRTIQRNKEKKQGIKPRITPKKK